jgi:4-hydroxy-4-methyl-2-oxoglutarate aldolase
MPLSAHVLERLRSHDTPTICNVIELFDVRPRTVGYMDQRISACFPDLPPAVGFAATATFRASVPPHASDGYGSIEAQVERFAELSGPPLVVFQDLDSPSVAATFGEIMCSVYQAFGAVGLVTSGTGRDLNQVRALGFPVFTSGTTCAHGYCQILHLQVPVHVGGIVVQPDDLLHADRNGVTTIPLTIAAEVAEIADAFVAAEQVVLDTVRHGSPSVAHLIAARAEMKARIAALHRQVSRRKAPA